MQELLLRLPLETLTNSPADVGVQLAPVRDSISGSEGSTLLAGSEGTGSVKRFLGRRQSFGWQKKKKKALRVTDFKRKIHPKMGGGGDAVEKILNLGLGTSLAFPTLPCVRILRLCLIHILSPSYILRQAEC